MIGAVVAGRFRIEREAGTGGMGTVYRAWDLVDGVPVALKILASDGVSDTTRFAQEASILAELSHPAIVHYVAHGTTGGQPYLAMEWLEGETLATRIEQNPLGLHESLAVVRRTAEALGAAHAHGIVHRDIKPENLFLPGGEIGALKLLDFGVARLVRMNRRLTKTGALVGTPGYFAPEIILGNREVDGRADLFSLGCVAFRCLTGHAPFESDELAPLLAKVVLQDAPSVRSLAATVPEGVAELVAWMLHKEPDKRPTSCQALLEALARFEELPDAPPEYRRRRNTHRLTLTERRLTCLVMIGPAAGEGLVVSSEGASMEQTANTAVMEPLVAKDTSTNTSAPAPLEAELRALFGAALHAFPDRSFVITLPANDRATDLAVRAARVALVARRHLGNRPIVVASGQANASDSSAGVGAVIEEAARLLAETPVGRIRLQDVVAAFIDPRFELVRDGERIFLESERELIQAKRRLLGRSTEFVGRSRELASLLGMLTGSVDDEVAQAALVVGAAGIGKSRLMQEFFESARKQVPRMKLLFAAGDSLAAGSPFALLARALRRHAGITDGEPIEESRRKLVDSVTPIAPPEGPARLAAFLGEIAHVEFPDSAHEALRAARGNPQLMGDGMRRAFQDWLRAECQQQPVLLVLEDLHWGDSGTVGFLDAALRTLREHALMVVAFARPEVHETFPDLWDGRDLQVIELGPLSRKASEKLVREAMGPDTPPADVAGILARADGNPFYLEELIRAAHEGRREGLPDSVLGMVQARLDAEGNEAKQVLRAASVFGERFSLQGLGALLGGEAELPDVATWIERLVQRELIGRGAAPAGAEGELVFSHALIREAAYATLTEGDRVLGHRLAGEHLEQVGCPDAMVLAEHYRRGREPIRALRFYGEAARQALMASDLAGALARAEVGLQAAATIGKESSAPAELVGALRLTQAEAHLWRGEFAQAEERGTQAVESLLPGGALWFRAIGQVIIAVGKQGRVDRLQTWAERAADGSVREQPHNAQVVCLAWATTYLVFAGRTAQADAVMDRMTAVARSLADPDPEALALVHQARAARASLQGDLGACLQALEAALGAFVQASDGRNVATLRANVGFVYAELGVWDRAEWTLREALEDADRMGLPEVRAIVYHNLGRVLARRGAMEEGERLERLAIESFAQQGEPRLETLARVYLAEILLLMGDANEAERQAQAALQVLTEAPGVRVQAAGLLARAQLARGEVGAALQVARQAAKDLEGLGGLDEGEAEVRLTFAECLQAAGAAAEARVAIEAARARLLGRAVLIGDPDLRRRFLADVPAHARTLALADSWQEGQPGTAGGAFGPTLHA